jgi:hypothetical protein
VAYLLRVIGRLLVLVAVLMLPGLVHAFACTEYKPTWTNAPDLGWHQSKNSACAAVIAHNNSTSGACMWNGQPGSVTYSMVYSDPVCRFQSQCSAPGSPAGSQDEVGYLTRQGTCSCAWPYVEVGGQCVHPCTTLTGQAPNSMNCTGTRCTFYAGAEGSSSPTQACDMHDMGDGSPAVGCMVNLGGLDLGWYDSEEGKMAWRFSGPNKYSGAGCTIGGSTPGTGSVTGSGTSTATVTVPDITPDHEGKCPGTVNGVEVWVACDKTMTPGKQTTTTFTTTPDGTLTQTVSKDSSTTCANGHCTTTVTITTTESLPNGSSTTTVSGGSSTGNSLGGFCAENPGASICKDGEGTFGGSCTENFQCSGDAVQCAVAKAVNVVKCSLAPDGIGATETAIYTAAKGAGTATGVITSTVDVGTATFSTSDLVGTPAGLVDKTFEFSLFETPHSFTVPFSMFNDLLTWLGYILLTISFLTAIKIIARGQ